MPLFPLPVTAFEHYLLADDRPDYPMTCFVRLQFRGRFERSRFMAALGAALAAHPLFQAKLTGDPRGATAGLRWVSADGELPFLCWGAEDHPPAWPRGVPIDLSREIGLRLWLREGANHTRLLLQVHHACSDGLGILQFIETLLGAYTDDAASAAATEPISGDFRRLRAGKPSEAPLFERLSHSYRAVSRLLRYFWSEPARLAVPAPITATSIHDSPPHLISHFFSVDETRALLESAKRLQVSVNALLVREFLLTLDSWNSEFGRMPGTDETLRVLIPVSLRDEGAGRLPAFNGISFHFLDRTSAEIRDAQALVMGLESEIQETRQIRRSLAMIPALQMLGRIPGGVSRMVREEACLATSVFSNLGVLFPRSCLSLGEGHIGAGDVVLESVEAAPPVRPNTLASFATLTYGNRLTISVCYDASRMTRAAGTRLLTRLVERLQSLDENPRGDRHEAPAGASEQPDVLGDLPAAGAAGSGADRHGLPPGRS